MNIHLKYIGLSTLLLLILALAACSSEPTQPQSNDSLDSTNSQENSPSIENEASTSQSSPPDRLAQQARGWNTNWSKHIIPFEELMSGGPPRDGIPSIDEPKFVSSKEAQAWLGDKEPVIALEINNIARAYPLQILMWHEIVNDSIDDIPILVTFCPLCNSSIVFERLINGQIYEFGTSGLLRYSDLVMYDRTTDSLWQQLTGEAIVGDMIGLHLEPIQSHVISFEEFRKAYSDGVILSTDTGYSRSYGNNPYVGYDRIDSSPFLFDGESDGRLRPMERVVTVSFDSKDKAYPLTTLREIGVIEDQINNQSIVVFFNSGTNSALDSSNISDGRDIGSTGVFQSNLEGTLLTFYVDGETIRDHQTNSSWNILGHAMSGPSEGQRLTPIVHGNYFWFAWAAFKPETEIYQGD